MWKKVRLLIIFIAFLIGLGIVGEMDYQDAVRAEREHDHRATVLFWR